MTFYQDPKTIHKTTSTAFDAVNKPGDTVNHSGIYRCNVCDQEIVSTFGNKFPPQNHHQHPEKEDIEWQLIATPRHNQQVK